MFGDSPPGFYFVIAMTALILVLAANTAFNGFPVLGSILAQDRFLPRQLHTRGDRLAFSNGILMLAGLADACSIVAFDAEVTRLIQLYIVGVFVSFTLSQSGMVRHWNRQLRTETDPAAPPPDARSRVINAFGAAITGVVLVIVLVTKFLPRRLDRAPGDGAFFFVLMQGIRRHYDGVADELAPDEDDRACCPSRVHAIVLVSKLHKPTLRALAFASATRPDALEARLTVNVDDADDPTSCRRSGSAATSTSRSRSSTRRTARSPGRSSSTSSEHPQDSPRDVVARLHPASTSSGHWWEQLLHNQSALRLKGPAAVPARA